MVAKIRPVRVTRGNVDVGCDLCVDFLKLAPSRDFETSSSAVRKLFLVFMCRHGGHVGVQDKKKVFWEFDFIIMQNLSDVWPLFCAPIWLSHGVSEGKE